MGGFGHLLAPADVKVIFLRTFTDVVCNMVGPLGMMIFLLQIQTFFSCPFCTSFIGQIKYVLHEVVFKEIMFVMDIFLIIDHIVNIN